jgi:hypothetical protein
VRRLDAAFTQWEKGIAGFRARRVKAGSARRAKDERIGGFHPVASREAALAGSARRAKAAFILFASREAALAGAASLGVRRLDAAFARWEKALQDSARAG